MKPERVSAISGGEEHGYRTVSLQLLPRLIRLRDAPGYLGMDRNKFNADVRPDLTEVWLGPQSVAFDRLELDAWIDDYIVRNGRRLRASKPEDDICQTATVCRASASKAVSGRSKNAAKSVQAAGSVKARDALAALRRKAT
jgi:predicted DNA-binding transcriptional regulator AlpA